MTLNGSIFAGADVGASRTKVALLDTEKNLVGFSVRKSGTDFTYTADECLEEALGRANISRKNITRTSFSRRSLN